MKRQVISLLLCAAMLLSLAGLGGCGSRAAAETPAQPEEKADSVPVLPYEPGPVSEPRKEAEVPVLAVGPEGGWTDEEVERVLRRTGFDLSRYSLDMMVGEGGKSLSGGESQRVSIARMLIRKPQILVLDEPTAFADAEGTACIIDILREERDSGRTVIVISHDDRLDTMADHIFNLR